MTSIIIRPLRPSDDMLQLTELIRAAYAPHAAAGLSFWATRQSIEDTKVRCASGFAYVAEMSGRLVGTITVKGPQPNSPVPAYRDGTTWTFVQFAVAPGSKGLGIGRALHAMVLDHVGRHGGTTVAIDTAEPATALIQMYARWGYSRIGTCDWRPHTNYLSVVLSRALTQS